jgi:DNA-binding phage protein
MPIGTVPFDSAQYVKTEADIARYLEAVLEANDPALHRHARTKIDSTWAAIRQARNSSD